MSLYAEHFMSSLCVLQKYSQNFSLCISTNFYYIILFIYITYHACFISFYHKCSFRLNYIYIVKVVPAPATVCLQSHIIPPTDCLSDRVMFCFVGAYMMFGA